MPMRTRHDVFALKWERCLEIQRETQAVLEIHTGLSQEIQYARE
jgi:hypothetical protein